MDVDMTKLARHLELSFELFDFEVCIATFAI